MAQTLTGFTTWAQLIDHVRADYPLYYHAPMDVRASQVTADVRRDGKLRVTPHWSHGADPFTADVGHLDRFRRDYSRVTLRELGGGA